MCWFSFVLYVLNFCLCLLEYARFLFTYWFFSWFWLLGVLWTLLLLVRLFFLPGLVFFFPMMGQPSSSSFFVAWFYLLLGFRSIAFLLECSFIFSPWALRLWCGYLHVLFLDIFFPFLFTIVSAWLVRSLIFFSFTFLLLINVFFWILDWGFLCF